MFGLETIADAFDRMHAQAQRDVDTYLIEKPGQAAGKLFGPDSIWNYSTAIPAGIAYSLITFTMGAGKGLVDVLRLGEGVKSGTVKGVAEDGLRVLNLVPALGVAAKGVGMAGKFATVAAASRVAGGGYVASCGATSTAAASMLSGTRVVMTIDEVGSLVGNVSPKSPTFSGMWYPQIKGILMGIAPATEELDMNSSAIKNAGIQAIDATLSGAQVAQPTQSGGAAIKAVEAAAAQGKGPVLFGVNWWSNVRGVMVPLRNANLGATEAADHWMVAFKNVRGQVMVADQYGVRPISELGKIGGRVTNFGVTSRALRVPEAGFVRAMSTLQNGPAVTAMTGGSGGAQWLATSLGVEMVIVNAPTTWNLDAAVRETLGRPPRDWSSITNGNSLAGTGGNGTPGGGLGSGENEIPTPLSPPLPNIGSSTLIDDSGLVLSKVPQSGRTTEFAQLVVDTGLSPARVRNALLQLLRSGMVNAKKWFLLDGQQTPTMITRGLQIPR